METDSVREAFRFSRGSLLVLGATLCWGLENNCTRRIANHGPIVTLKGFGFGFGILLLALAQNNAFPSWQHMLVLLLLGFVA
ncbi:MAG: hypothetical protein II970_02200 [Paludibacteraceae bacterium]|nr:hypothetical protein [Paludibacteraceae bacterium]